MPAVKLKNLAIVALRAPIFQVTSHKYTPQMSSTSSAYHTLSQAFISSNGTRPMLASLPADHQKDSRRNFYPTGACCENAPQNVTPEPSPLIRQIKDRIGTDNIEQINGFRLFKVEQKFNIDTKNLRRELRSLQKLLHPDKFATASESVKIQSQILSALVNEFFQILSNPYERGRYLLCLESGQAAENVDEKLKSIKLEEEFLERMMDIGSRVYSQISDLSELNKLFDELSSDYKNLTRQLEQAFSARDYESVIKLLARMKFVGNNHQAVARLID